jgi:hypothetical protein
MTFAEDRITAAREVVDLNAFVVLNFFDQVYINLLRKLILRFDLIENCPYFLVVEIYMRKILFIFRSFMLERLCIFGCG